MRVYDLRTNNKRENINVDSEKPVFGWKLQGEEKGILQESYQIMVRNEKGTIVWDSGEVVSQRAVNIPYEGETLASSERYFWKVKCMVRSEEGTKRIESAETFFETGYYRKEDWKGCFIGEREDHVYHLFRKTFSSQKKLKRAKLYVCGMGHFECWLNGSRVSDNVLEPGWTNYDKTCFYTACDVSALIKEGKNAALVKLGDGMFNVPGGRYVYYERSYGKCKLLFQLELLYEDGSAELVISDTSWKMTKSPVLFCCIYGGEDYDARLWKEEYLYPQYREEEGLWESCIAVEPPKGVLRAMPVEPVKVRKTYDPVSITRLENGEWLYDFGINFSGWVRIRVCTNGKQAGERIVLSPREYMSTEVKFLDKGYHTYALTYILDEKKEQEFAPDFTYTGFRYVVMKGAVPAEYEEEGKDAAFPVIAAMKGEFIYPDVEQAGAFSCSNQLFNDIHKIVLQAILSNTKSYFTDCPHREKLGWLEQSHLIGPSIMYNLEVHNLYDKIESDMADSQRENGLVPDICPEYVTGFEKWHKGFVDSPEWGSACILAPWYAYKRYGDAVLLKRHYDTMKRYLNYLDSRTHHEMLHHGLGDWLDIGPCPPNSQNTPIPVVATCIYYYDLCVMKQVAFIIGKEEDAAEYEERRQKVFTEYNLQFLDDQTGRYANGSQTAQAMSLIVGLVPEEMEKKAIKQLRTDVVNRNYAITAGDVGHPFLLAALMKYGMSDLINEMTNCTETPGYGYQVVNGATTLTENWDGPDPKHPHGSQNHLMLGSIEEWFYGGLGGMELIRNDLDFDELCIMPHPEKGVDWVKAWVLHPYGRVSVEWKVTAGEVQVYVQIPANVRAKLCAPDGTVCREVGSGSYTYSFPVKREVQEEIPM